MQEGWTGSVPQVSSVRAALPVRPLGQGADARPIPAAQHHDTVEISGGGDALHAYAKFIVHDDNIVSIQIIDATTEQVLREIPSKEVLRIAQQLNAYLAAKQQRAG